MANVFNLASLTLNPNEVQEVKDFIITQVYEKGELAEMYNIFTGVLMKSQIIKLSQLGMSGVEAATDGCAYATSNSTTIATQKYWEPAKIEDLFEICMNQAPALMKAFFNKVKSYKEINDVTGSDEILVLVAMVEDAIKEAINRLIWFGNKEVASANASTAGLISVTDAKFYNPINGYFKQLELGVTGETVKKVDIHTLQGESLTSAQSYKVFMDAYKLSDSRVRGAVDGAFYVSGDLFIGLEEYLINNSLNFESIKFEEGVKVLKFMGHRVYNMENAWRFNQLSFVNNTTDNEVDRPTRLVFTTKANLGIATLDNEDFVTIDSWYSKDDRKNKTTYGFTLDAKVIDEALCTVAW